MLYNLRKNAFVKSTLCTAALLLGVQPVFTALAIAADIEVDQAAPSAQQAHMSAAANGVPIQNIAKPNTQGLSHNKFSNFNIGRDNLIINNSAVITNSQLAGYIVGNSNLAAGQEAHLILNEVTSSNRTQLNGYSEIVGKPAGLIIANPNGIRCDGCGFINTPKATLSTGVADFQNSALRLLVDRGAIEIAGQGLNAGTVDSVELMAQAIQVNGQINAQHLQIIAGNNEIAPSAEGLTPVANVNSTAAVSSTVAAPHFAIESSALGGMYANRISLLATDAGVGVKLDGDLAATTQDMSITADGQLVFKKHLLAHGDMHLTSKSADVSFDNAFESLHAKNVAINAQTHVHTAGQLSSEKRLSINAQQNIHNQATLNAGISSDSQGQIIATQQGELNLQAGRDIVNGGVMSADDATLQAQQNLINDGTLKVDKGVFQAQQDIVNNGTIQADELQLQAMRDIQNQGIASAKVMDLNAAQNIPNTKTLEAQQLTLTAGNTINNQGANTQHANIVATQALTLNAQNLNNNTGTIGSGGELNANISDTFNNKNNALLFSQQQMYLHTDTLDNENATLFSGGDLHISGADTNAASAVINSSANIESLGSININAAQIDNQKAQFEQQADRLTSGDITWACHDCKGDHYYITYHVNEVLANKVTEDSPASRILANGDIYIESAQLNNLYSHIEANGNVDISADDVVNKGSAQGTIVRTTDHFSGYITNGTHGRTAPYITQYNHVNTAANLSANPDSAVPAPAQILSYGITNEIETFTPGQIDAATIKAGGDIHIVASNGIVQENGERGGNIAQVAINNQSQNVTLSEINILPTNGLFVPSTNPTSRVLFETNPAFTQLGNFINSDYMLNLLDSSGVFTALEDSLRLGDAYYEQQYVREQILAKTGQRYLNASYANDQAQYIALMDSAVTQTHALQLVPGVALSAAQVAALTSDMVWLEYHEVNGQQVLVPVVYLSQLRTDNLDNNAARITAQNVDIITGEAGISNSGSLAAEKDLRLVSLGNINNFGKIVGGDVSIATAQDFTQQSTRHQDAMIKSTDGDINLYAQGDINSARSVTTRSGESGRNNYRYDIAGKDSSMQSTGAINLTADKNINLQAAKLNSGAEMNLNAGKDVTIASIGLENNYEMHNRKSHNIKESVSHVGSKLNSQGALNINAGKDIAVKGSTVHSAGDAELSAGNDVLIEATANRNYSDNYSKSKHRKTKQINEDINHQAAVVSSDQNITLVAGNNIEVKAGIVEAKNDALLIAANDIEFDALKDKHYAYFYKKSSGRSGLSKTTKTKAKLTDEIHVIGGEINAQSITAQAGNDVRFKASSAIADQDITVKAGGNVDVVSDMQYASQMQYTKTTKSGVMGSGGIGFTVGSMKQSREQTQQATQVIGSTVASLEGGINIEAQKEYNQIGSNLTALKGDINVDAERINIEAAENSFVETDKTKYSKGGVSVGLSGQLVALENQIKSVVNTGEKGQTTGDSRRDTLVQGMRAYSAAESAMDVAKGVSDAAKIMGDGASILNPDATIGNVNMGIHISLAAEKSESDRRYESTTSKASTVLAGGDINLTAKGDAQNSDITIEGSQLDANNINLKAEDAIDLKAAADTTKLRDKNKNSSDSIGVNIGVGDQTGIAITAGVGLGKGHSDGDSTQWQETLVAAKNAVNISSGGDTQIKGAQVIGDKVTAEVGGNLEIASLQDAAKFESEQKQGGANISVCVPPICYGTTVKGSAHYSASEINNNYQSVSEQSGIYAGEQGFDIHVGKHTQLDGAVIASKAGADKNKLSTQSLGHTQLNNFEESDASSMSLSGSFTYEGAGSKNHKTWDDAANNGQGGVENKTSKTEHGRFDQGNVLSDNIGNVLTHNIIDDAQSSTTYSAIAAGQIEVRDDAVTGKDSLVGLSRDTESANNALKRTFNEADAREKVEIAQFNRQVTQEATQLGMRKVGDYFKAQTDDLVTERYLLSQLAQEGALSEAEQTRLDVINASLAEYETQRAIMHGVVAAIGAALGDGNVARAAGGTITGHVLGQIAQERLKDSTLSADQKDVIINAIASAGGALTGGQGAVAASLGDAYNRQLHPAELNRLKELAKKWSANREITYEEALARLTQRALIRVDTATAKQYQAQPLDTEAEQIIRANSLQGFYDERGVYTRLFVASSKEDRNDSDLYAYTKQTYKPLYTAAQAQQTPAGGYQQTVKPKALSERDQGILRDFLVQELQDVPIGIAKGVGNIPSDLANVVILSAEGYYNMLAIPLGDGTYKPLARVPNLFDYSSDVQEAASLLAALPVIEAGVLTGTMRVTAKMSDVNVPDKSYNPTNPGPLNKDIADTFRSGTYTEKITMKETTLYRVISDDGNPAGSYLTRERPQGSLQSVIDSALDQNWGNTATRVVELKIPPGTKLYEGVAAFQRGLVGGGNQIYIPKVDLTWVVE